MPLYNNTNKRRIDEKSQRLLLVEKKKFRFSKNFSIRMDESIMRDSEALLLAYVRYIDKSEFVEEMLFCESSETTSTATDIYIIN